MHVDFVPFEEEWIEAVAQFNGRLRERGQTLLFPASPTPEWLPKIPGRKIYQEFYLAVDRDRCVRGGYLLKRQNFWLGGKTVSIGDFQLPISEGIIDRRWLGVGIAVLRNIERREPLLFALGMGESSEAMPRLLAASGWSLTPVPFFFRIVRPFPFLRNIVYLRRKPALRILLDFLAVSGVGGLGIRVLQGAVLGAQGPPRKRASNSLRSLVPGPTTSGKPARASTASVRCAIPKPCASFIPGRTPASSASGYGAAGGSSAGPCS